MAVAISTAGKRALEADLDLAVPVNLGPKREIKFAVESYWGGKSSAEDLQKVAEEIRKQSWTNVKAKGVDYIPRQVTQLYLSSSTPGVP